MSLPYRRTLIPLAKNLRKEATPQENRLWYQVLRSYPVRFQRQKAIGSYIADFYCHAARLVIELDGDQHGEPQAMLRDAERTEKLEAMDLRVLRFTNREVDTSLDAVCDAINRAVRDRLPPEKAKAFQPPETEFDEIT